MSRQSDRARARRQAKIDTAGNFKPGYPAGRYVPVMARGKTYAPNGKQEVARRLRQAILQAAA
jgi:hypothetical protein